MKNVVLLQFYDLCIFVLSVIFVSWCSSIMTEIYLVYSTGVMRSAVWISFHLVPLFFCISQDGLGIDKGREKEWKTLKCQWNNWAKDYFPVTLSLYHGLAGGLCSISSCGNPHGWGHHLAYNSKSSRRVTICSLKSSVFKWKCHFYIHLVGQSQSQGPI